MGFRFTLRTPDGDDAGEVELSFTPQPGDEIIVDGNQRVTVTAVIPLPVIEEFVSRPVYGALEVKPAPRTLPSSLFDEPPDDGFASRAS